MRATYQEITDKMRAAFFDACGEKPEDLPELDARFRSVATELYALSVFGDHVQSQVFADTARVRTWIGTRRTWACSARVLLSPPGC